MRRIGKFERAIANVARFGDACADIVTQIASEMQQQMADAVAVGIGLAPELFGRERRNEYMDAVADLFVIGSECRSDKRGEFRHRKASRIFSNEYKGGPFDAKVDSRASIDDQAKETG